MPSQTNGDLYKPDWDSITTISNGFVAPSLGFIYLTLHVHSSGVNGSKIYVNEKLISRSHLNGGGSPMCSDFPFSIILKSGDKITWTADSTTISYFVPLK